MFTIIITVLGMWLAVTRCLFQHSKEKLRRDTKLIQPLFHCIGG